MDNKYEIVAKQLMHERNELRKYMIDVCKLLGIDTSQSVLGANCLEFYAVLSSTAKNKINYMEGYIRTVENTRDKFDQELKRKEQALSELFNCLRQANRKRYAYKQALDEIEQTINNFPAEGVREIPQTQMEYTQYFLSINEAKLQKTLNIINKARESK